MSGESGTRQVYEGYAGAMRLEGHFIHPEISDDCWVRVTIDTAGDMVHHSYEVIAPAQIGRISVSVRVNSKP